MNVFIDMTNSVTFEQSATEEDIIYRELGAIYLETQSTGFVSKSIWQRVNSLLVSMSKRNPRYNGYILTSNNVAESIPVMTFKQKLRSAIEVMRIEYGLEDISEIVKKDHQSAGMNVHNIVTASPTQKVSQDVSVTINEEISLVVKEIENNLTDDQLKKIRPLINEYKNKPTRHATEKLLSGIWDLGKDIGIGVLANIISTRMGI